jgi:mRNA-degrading endonuclease toxin of MazEF toxin-antitoxin module
MRRIDAKFVRKGSKLLMLIDPSQISSTALTFASKALTEQIKAVDKQRIVKKLGTLPPAVLAQVERSIKNTLAFP